MTDASVYEQLAQMLDGYWVSQAICAAARFGFADKLRDGPKTASELADATSTRPDAVHRLLRALASVGIFAEDESGRFALTPLAEPLRSDVAGSKRAYAMMTGDLQYRALAEIDHCVRTGEGAFDRAFGKPLFEQQNTRFVLAECAALARTGRVFADDCLLAHLDGTLDVATAAMAKFHLTDSQCTVVDKCLQLFGGYGYTTEYPIARLYQDARVQKIYAGTNEVMKELVARSL
mgnify:CR=1 FL=1